MTRRGRGAWALSCGAGIQVIVVVCALAAEPPATPGGEVRADRREAPNADALPESMTLQAATPDVEAVLARFAGEPTIEQVQGWAAQVARVDGRTVGRWLADARRFAALPEVRLEYGFGDDWSSDYDSFDAFGNPPTTEDAATEQVRTGAGTDRSQDVGIKATWDLPSLLMSTERLRAIDQAIDAAKLRGSLLEEVTRLYFARRRLQVDMLLAPRLDAQGRVEDALKLDELTAQLDAFTGGRFGEALAR